MKSLFYRLFKQPHNLEDCIDLLSKNHVRNISLNLTKDEIFRTEFTAMDVVQLIAEFTFDLSDRQVCYSQICATYDVYGPDEKKKRAIHSANRRLEEMVAEFNRPGYRVQGDSACFALDGTEDRIGRAQNAAYQDAGAARVHAEAQAYGGLDVHWPERGPFF